VLLELDQGCQVAEDAARHGSRYPAEHNVALRGTALIKIAGQLSGQFEG